MPLGYIGRVVAREIDWMAVLAFVEENGRVSPKEVALGLGLGHLSEVKHRGSTRQVHTGPAEANTRLKRLQTWGMLHRTVGPVTYEITDYGRQILDNPTVGQPKRKPKR